MKSLQEDIRQKEFKNVYLFYGEEAYLKQVYKKRMKEALLPDGDEMNFTFFEGKKTEPQEVIQMAQTMPFFAERRVIFLENTGFFKGQCESLPEYLSQLPEYLCMIFIEEEVDKRSRMYKAVKKSGRIVEFAKQDSDMLIRWIFGILNKEQKKNYEIDFIISKKNKICPIEVKSSNYKKRYGTVFNKNRHGYGKY